MHINAFFVTFHVTEVCQRSTSSCRICHACTAVQMLQICFFPVGYDMLRQCIITPVKGAHGTLIQNIVSTSYYSTVSNSKTSRVSSRTNAWRKRARERMEGWDLRKWRREWWWGSTILDKTTRENVFINAHYLTQQNCFQINGFA